jgi:hypothetical protein
MFPGDVGDVSHGNRVDVFRLPDVRSAEAESPSSLSGSLKSMLGQRLLLKCLMQLERRD